MTVTAASTNTNFAFFAGFVGTGSNGIMAGGCLPTTPIANPSNARTEMVGGKVQFENDNYRITAGDDNTVTIHNKNTGETYQAWGDPHMNVDGQHAFDFWGTTTLQLDDGTKVTIETTPWANNPEMTLSSKVTITNGDYGVQISGVDTNKTGDLKIDEAPHHGSLLDALVDDGNVLHENPAGKGFLAVDSQGRIRAVDQKYINETDLKKGGALQAQANDAFRQLAGLMSIAFVGGFIGGFLGGLVGATRDGGEGREHPGEFTQPTHLRGHRAGVEQPASEHQLAPGTAIAHRRPEDPLQLAHPPRPSVREANHLGHEIFAGGSAPHEEHQRQHALHGVPRPDLLGNVAMNQSCHISLLFERQVDTFVDQANVAPRQPIVLP